MKNNQVKDNIRSSSAVFPGIIPISVKHSESLEECVIWHEEIAGIS